MKCLSRPSYLPGVMDSGPEALQVYRIERHVTVESTDCYVDVPDLNLKFVL